MAQDNKQVELLDLSSPLNLEPQKLAEARRRIEKLFEANGKLSGEHRLPIAGSSF